MQFHNYSKQETQLTQYLVSQMMQFFFFLSNFLHELGLGDSGPWGYRTLAIADLGDSGPTLEKCLCFLFAHDLLSRL